MLVLVGILKIVVVGISNLVGGVYLCFCACCISRMRLWQLWLIILAFCFWWDLKNVVYMFVLLAVAIDPNRNVVVIVTNVQNRHV